MESVLLCFFFFFFQAEDGIRDAQESRGLGDVYKRQDLQFAEGIGWIGVPNKPDQPQPQLAQLAVPLCLPPKRIPKQQCPTSVRNHLGGRRCRASGKQMNGAPAGRSCRAAGGQWCVGSVPRRRKLAALPEDTPLTAHSPGSEPVSPRSDLSLFWDYKSSGSRVHSRSSSLGSFVLVEEDSGSPTQDEERDVACSPGSWVECGSSLSRSSSIGSFVLLEVEEEESNDDDPAGGEDISAITPSGDIMGNNEIVDETNKRRAHQGLKALKLCDKAMKDVVKEKWIVEEEEGLKKKLDSGADLSAVDWVK
eukprot:TRINITY_DN7357_c0_g1_i1.p1 TRINITY_DN7357_c0_g1~~TRINITY_DN7357_c0_g1_i1.p1  ORF type:complete len:307 (-),score=70.72 TRINITY_DN7357_c0_g1_i1:380-1300(-)